MEQNQTLTLYEEILQGAHMGIDAVDELSKRAEDDHFKQELLGTQNDYKYIARQAEERIQALGGIPHELSAPTRMMTWGMVGLQTLTDHSNAKLAEMLLKGMDMADKGMADKAHAFEMANDDAKQLARTLKELQNRQRSVYRKYLN